MYKVVRMERQDDSVFRDDFPFADRKEAESFFLVNVKSLLSWISGCIIARLPVGNGNCPGLSGIINP